MDDRFLERMMMRDPMRDMFAVTADDILRNMMTLSLITGGTRPRGPIRLGGGTPKHRTANPAKKAARKRQRAARAKTRKAHA